MRWRADVHAALSCDDEVPEGEPFASAFAAAVEREATVLGTSRLGNGARLSVAVEAGDEAAAETRLHALVDRALATACSALAGADRDLGWTAGVGGLEPLE